MTDLDPLLGGKHNSTATAINNGGQVVGNAGVNAFLYSNGTVTYFGGSTDLVPNAINDAGQVAAYNGHGYVWSARQER